MATKKTATSRTKSKTTRKAKKASADAEVGEAQFPGTGGNEIATEEPVSATTKTRRKTAKKPPARRRKAAPAELPTAEQIVAEEATSAPAEAVAPPPSGFVATRLPEVRAPEHAEGGAETPAQPQARRGDEAEAAARQIEQKNEVIVIRFPPVAPPPFEPLRPVAPPEPKAVETPAPAAHVEAIEEPQAREDEYVEEIETPAPPAPFAAPRADIGVAEEEPSSADVDEVGEEPPAPAEELEGPPAAEAPRGPDRGEPGGFERRGRRRRRRRRPNGHDGDGRDTQRAPADARNRTEEPLRPRPAPPPVAVEPPAPGAPAGPPGPRHLSSSQKRRLRRRRRSQDNREVEPQVQAPPPAPELAPPPEPAEPEAPAGVPDETDGVALTHIPGLGDEALPEVPPFDETEDQVAVAPAQARAPGRERRPRQRPRRHAAEEELEAGEPEAEEAVAVGSKEMVINVVPGEECRIAILHKGKLEEMYIERASAESHVGNIYKGLVTNVEPSIQAAFIDFGLGKNGFLHVSDLHPQYFPDGGQPAENVGRKMPRRSRPPIQRCLRRGQQIIVQITKEGIGTKGPTLSTYLSIPGRFLVMMPGMRQLGVSRKIEDDEVRIKLRNQLHELELPEGMGFIARTAAQDRTKRELQSDLKYLMRLWSMITRRMKEERAPAELYRESDLVIRTIRDLYSAEIGRIVVDDASVAQRAREFLQIFSPRAGDVLSEYAEPVPIFHRYGIEAELERLHSRHVPLRSGGSLVIEPTEALVAIDVNSGKFRTEDDAEATAFKINMEAADEIARQLRLRDLGGVIICDFIDMRLESHKRAIERRLAGNLRHHKERAKILRMSQFGIIEMTRQRQRASLTRSVYQDCRFCHGTGLVKTGESVALDAMRIIQLNIIREPVRVIELTVSPEVAHQLLNRKRATLANLENKYRRTLSIRPEPNFGLDHMEVRCSDHRGRLIPPA